MTGFAVLAACTPAGGFQRFSGPTMGTFYTVSVAGNADCTRGLSLLVAAELQRVNAQMSTYLPDSELSRFNAAQAGEWVAVSADLAGVVDLAQELARLSDGAFDITVGPLVNLWGFGVDEWAGVPARADIEEAAARVGHERLEVRRSPPALRKRLEGVHLDLSAIAKGHGVDRLADLLNGRGCTDYLVEIGGEIRARGLNPRGTTWRIAVENPEAGGEAGGEVGGEEGEGKGKGARQQFVRLSAGALATSGDYRRFRIVDGARFSHTIDPRTGWPVTHRLASVTVLAETAALADGIATLINVLGPVDGLKFAEQRGIAALALVRRDGGFDRRYTGAMREYVNDFPEP